MATAKEKAAVKTDADETNDSAVTEQVPDADNAPAADEAPAPEPDEAPAPEPDAPVPTAEETPTAVGAPHEQPAAPPKVIKDPEPASANLEGPKPKETPTPAAPPTVGSVGAALAASASGRIIDARTGDIPLDPDSLFVKKTGYGNVYVLQTRLIEQFHDTGRSAPRSRVLLGFGANLPEVDALRLRSLLTAQLPESA